MSTLNLPKISVITPVFNGASYIEKSIISVLSQTYENIEYIIIDGGSNDNTINIIEKYKNTIDFFVSENDLGIYDAMNKGVDIATGDWIYFLGSDDILLEDFSTSISYLKNNNCVYYGNVLFKNSRKIYDGKFTKYKLLFKNISHQAIIYPSAIIRNEKYDLRYEILADYHLNIKLFSKFKFVFINKILCNFNDGMGVSATKKDICFLNDRKSIYKEFFGAHWAFIYIVRRGVIKRIKNFLQKI